MVSVMPASYIENTLLPFFSAMEERIDSEGRKEQDHNKGLMLAGMISAIEMTREMIEADREKWDN